jgi:cell division protein FtsB
VSRARRIGWLVFLGSAVFALAGGEYSTWDWLTLRREERAEQDRVGQLQSEVDSLRAYLRALGSDARLQEQVAREEFGMIRRGEYLYRLEPDTGSER